MKNLSGNIAKDLDFYRIRDHIASYCTSEEGKEELLKRESDTDLKKITLYKNLGFEWNKILHSKTPEKLNSWDKIKDLLSILKVEGASLQRENFFSIGKFIQSTQNIKKAADRIKDESQIDNIFALTQSIPDLSNAASLIFHVIDSSTGQVRDLAELREYRIKIAKLHKDIENALRKYTSDSSLSNVLQSNVPAYRADRQLLAVRADKKNQIKGIIHEVSSSGQTVYIEVEEVVRANNELVEAEYQLDAEIRKIFLELTKNLSPYREDLCNALEKMLLLDTTYASARWMDEIHGIFAEDCDKEKEAALILQARHPLLGDKAVPVDINFQEGKRVLIITGPNTGGKTVTLKTIALFCLLNQAGFPVPAKEGTKLPVFESIYADIGDEQSIDESLSTFSSHMKKTAQMLNEADENSLLLLDELGSGTDPLEGGAIAMAVLDRLLEKKCFILVTTHHGILKNYGYTHPLCINASVEFDNSFLKPTYRLLMGVPGESHAIDIAEKNGLTQDVILKARNYITSEQADVSSLIKGLTAKHEELDSILKEQKLISQKIEEEKFTLNEKEILLKEKELELKKIEHTASSHFLEETRSKLENLVRELREGEINREKTLGVKKFIADLTAAVEGQKITLDREEKNLNEEKLNAKKEEKRLLENGIKISSAKHKASSGKKNKKQKLSAKEAFAKATVTDFSNIKNKKNTFVKKELVFEEGAQILAGPSKRKGILVSEIKKGIWSVQFDSIKMNVPQNQMILVKPENYIQSQSQVIIESSDDELCLKNEVPKFELRLLGMRYEEAQKALEHQIDLCAVHNFKSFSIIHGTGNGVLQQMVKDYLSHYPGIKSFRYAQPEDGGFGKTYVELE